VVQIRCDANGTVLRFTMLPLQPSESRAEPTSNGPPIRRVGVGRAQGLWASGRRRRSHAESSGGGLTTWRSAANAPDEYQNPMTIVGAFVSCNGLLGFR
jgi:hypothetical protein